MTTLALLAILISPALSHEQQSARLDKAIGVQARQALESAKTVQVLAIDPYPTGGKGDHVDGRTIKKSVSLTDPAARRKAIDALYKGLLAEASPSKCYEPRHALRVKAGKDTFDYVMCFACGWYHTLKNHKTLTTATLGGSPAELDKQLARR